MSDIVVFGAGPVTDVVVTYLERFSEHRIVGYTVDAAVRDADEFRGRPLVDWEDLERHFPPDRVRLLGPVSYRRLNDFRRARFLGGKARGYDFASFVHPRSENMGAPVGENCFILEGNLIQPYATVGDNVVIWSNNHIAHHVTIADHCFITSCVGIAGMTRIGEGTFFGGHSGAIDNLSIGAGCLIGAGAIVATSLEPHTAVFAAPTNDRVSTPERLQRLL